MMNNSQEGRGEMEKSSGNEGFGLTPEVQGTGLITIDQQRAIAEVQAAMVVARMNPRNEYDAFVRIEEACKRKSLAEQALYAYPRGGTMVTGPSIRLAEVLARYWKNITYGLREMSRGDGSSEIEAFAWDLETNTRVTRQFQVRHVRETKQGSKALTGERDVYELVANMGQRRVRACILEIIPGDIVEAAVTACSETLKAGDGEPLEDRLRKVLLAFKNLGVTQEMLEAKLGHPLQATVPQEIVTLQKIYRSLNDGMATREELFNISEEEVSEIKSQNIEAIQEEFEAVVKKSKRKYGSMKAVYEYVTAASEHFNMSKEAFMRGATSDVDGFLDAYIKWAKQQKESPLSESNGEAEKAPFISEAQKTKLSQLMLKHKVIPGDVCGYYGVNILGELLTTNFDEAKTKIEEGFFSLNG